MSGQAQPEKIPTGERMAELASAKTDALMHKLRGEHETEKGARYTVDPAALTALIESWPEAPRKGAQKMIEQYGPPNEATPTKLFWYRNGPWKRTMVTRDIVTHNFPTIHSDYLTQVIDYKVPVDRISDIARFDGSCLVDRTAGEVAARCDSEAANIITLNLMHEIATGKKTVEEARKEFANQASAYVTGRPSPYAEGLRFDVPQGGTEDEDESIIAGAMARQATAKVKDMLTGSD